MFCLLFLIMREEEQETILNLSITFQIQRLTSCFTDFSGFLQKYCFKCHPRVCIAKDFTLRGTEVLNLWYSSWGLGTSCLHFWSPFLTEEKLWLDLGQGRRTARVTREQSERTFFRLPFLNVVKENRKGYKFFLSKHQGSSTVLPSSTQLMYKICPGFKGA